jgi:hypothetical protein
MSVVLAYFDPGAGSLLLQALLGGMGGIVVLWRYTCSQWQQRRLSHRDVVVAASGK